MRCWFLRSIWTGPVCDSTVIRFFAGSTWPLRRAHQHVVDVGRPAARSSSRSRTMIGYSLPRSRNMRGLRAGDVGADRVGDAGRRSGRAAPPWRDRRAPASSGRPSSRPSARRRCRAVLSMQVLARPARRAVRSVEILAADLERQTAVRLLPPPDRKRLIWLVAARRRWRGRSTPGMPDSCRRRSMRDLLARARPLVLRHEHDAGCCRGWPLPPPSHRRRRRRRRRCAMIVDSASGTQLAGSSRSSRASDRVGALDARAARRARR